MNMVFSIAIDMDLLVKIGAGVLIICGTYITARGITIMTREMTALRRRDEEARKRQEERERLAEEVIAIKKYRQEYGYYKD